MQVKMPELSESPGQVLITEWHAGENDRVTEGQDLFEVATDKATFDVPSPCSGTLTRIMKKEGDSADAGASVAEIQEAGDPGAS